MSESSVQHSRAYDVEAPTEEENDRGIDMISDRIDLLKKITKDIHGEAEAQNRVLDRLVSVRAMEEARCTTVGVESPRSTIGPEAA